MPPKRRPKKSLSDSESTEDFPRQTHSELERFGPLSPPLRDPPPDEGRDPRDPNTWSGWFRSWLDFGGGGRNNSKRKSHKRKKSKRKNKSKRTRKKR